MELFSKTLSNHLRLQIAKRIVVQKVFQQAKVVTSRRDCFRNKTNHHRKDFPTSKDGKQPKDLSSKGFYNHLGLQRAKRIVVQKVSNHLGLQLAKGIVVQKVFHLAKVATSRRNCRRKGLPTTYSCNQPIESSSKRFCEQQRLKPARGIVVEKVFQPAKVAISQRNCRRKGFPTT